MPTKHIIIDTNIHSILQIESFDNFTVLQLRDEYLNISDNSRNFVEARKFVYRHILRFVRLGLLQKKVAAKAKESTYYKTHKFFNTLFKTRLRPENKATKTTTSSKSTYDIMKIEEQLKKYQVDLLACLGESEEYMRLYKTNPEFKTLLEKEYLQARDKSSRLLGQIKALNTVIHHYS